MLRAETRRQNTPSRYEIGSTRMLPNIGKHTEPGPERDKYPADDGYRQHHDDSEHDAAHKHVPRAQAVTDRYRTDRRRQRVGQVIGHGRNPEIRNHRQGETLRDPDHDRDRNSGAGRVVDHVREDNVERHNDQDEQERIVHREPGDQSGKHLRCTAAVDERTERSAAGKEELSFDCDPSTASIEVTPAAIPPATDEIRSGITE